MGQNLQRVKRHVGVFKYISSTKRFQGRPDECFYITFKADGKKQRVKIGWRSNGIDAAYAAQKRAELLNQVRLGEQPRLRPPQSLTLAQAWQLYYDNHCLTNTKSPKKTLSRWNSLLKGSLGDSYLDEITPLALEEFKANLQAAGKGPKTIEHALSLLRRIFRKMVAWNKFVGKSPTDDVQWPKYDNRRERYLTPPEARALLKAVRARCRDKPKLFWRVCLVSLYTGMRFSEVAALRSENVNLDADTIRIQDTKAGRNRTVYFTGKAAKAFKGLDLLPGRLVFPARGGGQRTEPSDTFRRCVDEKGLNEGIDDRRSRVVFHTLRHTFGSWLAISGVPLYWIAKLMGHTNEEMTERYSHLCPGVQREAVGCIEAAFHGHDVTPGLWFLLSGSQNMPQRPGDDSESSGGDS